MEHLCVRHYPASRHGSKGAVEGHFCAAVDFLFGSRPKRAWGIEEPGCVHGSQRPVADGHTMFPFEPRSSHAAQSEAACLVRFPRVLSSGLQPTPGVTTASGFGGVGGQVIVDGGISGPLFSSGVTKPEAHARKLSRPGSALRSARARVVGLCAAFLGEEDDLQGRARRRTPSKGLGISARSMNNQA